MRTVEESWWVTGYADGHASFTFSRAARGRAAVTLYFAVRVGSDDRPVLERIRRGLGGVGQIYPTGEGASAYYRVARVGELLRIVEHFDAYPLQSARRRAYVIWREMVLTKAAHLGASTPPVMGPLADRLSVENRGL